MRTDAPRVCRNAVAAATRPTPARWSGRSRQAGPGRSRPQTGVALTAIGLIVALAVHVPGAVVNPQAAGLIVALAGLTWLCTPARHSRVVLRRQFRRVIRCLSWDDGQPTARCSLTELLEGGPRLPSGPPGIDPSAQVPGQTPAPAPLSGPGTDPG